MGTPRKARGKGLAKYCVQEVSNAAIDLGARKVVLQASKFGTPVYPKIGYREFTTYPHLFAPANERMSLKSICLHRCNTSGM